MLRVSPVWVMERGGRKSVRGEKRCREPEHEIYHDNASVDDANGVLQIGASGVVDRVEFLYNRSGMRVEERGQTRTICIDERDRLGRVCSVTVHTDYLSCGGATWGYFARLTVPDTNTAVIIFSVRTSIDSPSRFC